MIIDLVLSIGVNNLVCRLIDKVKCYLSLRILLNS